MNFKSVLKPEGSVMAGIAVAGTVFAIYQLNVGPVVQAHATPPNHPALESSRKKASWASFLAVSALTLLTKDGNIGILGYGTIVAMELSYRHAIMVSPETGQIIPPIESAFTPAGGPDTATNVVQLQTG